MKANNLNELERDNRFKRKYLPKNIWLKNPAIFPPASLLFVSLIGLVYLLNIDMLISYYAIPFGVMFFLGTIWLKAIKKHLLKNLFEKEGTFLVTLAKQLDEKEGWTYLLFTLGTKRHNKYFAQNLDKEVSVNQLTESPNFADIRKKAKKEVVKLELSNIINADSVYLIALKKDGVLKGKKMKETIAILYINNKNIKVIKQKDVDFS